MSKPFESIRFFQEISTLLSSNFVLSDVIQKIFELLHCSIGFKKGVLVLSEGYFTHDHIRKTYGFAEKEIQLDFKVWVTHMNAFFSHQGLSLYNPYSHHLLHLKEDYKGVIPDGFFLVFPIILGGDEVCIFYAYLTQKDSRLLEEYIATIAITLLMIAQELRLRRLMDKEHDVKIQTITSNPHHDGLKEHYITHNMIGSSRVMRKIYEEIQQVSSSNATVLIQGESGTGKELVANAIHQASSRVNHLLIKINCGAIPENLIESELFGYEKGAFTDASEAKIGKFEAANGGTLFLDEISELSLALQVKLLRVLQEKEIYRVGSNVPIKINVRIIAATNRHLEAHMNEGYFRKDLFYRLNVFLICLPPLRERRSDILLFAKHFLEKFSKENNKVISSFSKHSLDLLQGYSWPGNVRELENYIERAVVICSGDALLPVHFPASVQSASPLDKNDESDDFENLPFEEAVQNFERKFISTALKASAGNVARASRKLNTTQRILSYKIKKLGIKT